MAWGDSDDQLIMQVTQQSTEPDEISKCGGSQPQTLSGEQSNLQQSWNQVSRSSWEELNLSRLLEVLVGTNFRERNTNEEPLICQEERPEKMVPVAGESQPQKREISSMLTSRSCLAVWITVWGWGWERFSLIETLEPSWGFKDDGKWGILSSFHYR